MDPDRLYYAASLVNGASASSIEDWPVAQYSDQRSAPLLLQPQRYQCAIVRLNVQGAGVSLPVWTAVPQLGQSDPALLSYSVTLEGRWSGNVDDSPVADAVIVAGVNDQFVVSQIDSAGTFAVQDAVVTLAPGTYHFPDLFTAVQAGINGVTLGGGYGCSYTSTFKMTTSSAFGANGLNLVYQFDAPASVISPAVRAATCRLLGGVDGIAIVGSAYNPIVMPNSLSPVPNTLQTSPLFVSQASLRMIPAVAGAPAPLPPLLAPDNSGGYYDVYDVATVIRMVNAAFEAAHAALDAQLATWWAVGGFDGVAPRFAAPAPELAYNPAANILSMLLPSSAFDGTGYGQGRTSRGLSSAGGPFDEIMTAYVCETLSSSLYMNFPGTWQTNPTQGRDWQLVAAGAVPGTMNGAVPAWVVSQCYPSTDALSPVSALCVLSTMPTAKQTEGPLASIGGNIGGGMASTQDFSSIVTDLSVDIGGNAAAWRSSFVYQPTTYRWFSLKRGGVSRVPG